MGGLRKIRRMILHRGSINRAIRASGLKRLKDLGYNDADAEILLRENFREFKQAWISKYKAVQ